VKRVLLTGAGGFVGHHTLEHILETTDWEVVCIDSFRHRGKTDRIREVLDGQTQIRDCPVCSAGHETEEALNEHLRQAHVPWASRVKVLTHDLRVPISPQLDHEIGHIDYVISMASESHVDRSCVEPRPFIENNVALVLTLLEWTRIRTYAERASGLWENYRAPEKFLHVSTDEVYGPAPVGHDHAEGEPHRPSNPYSASKAAQEDIVYSYWRTFGLPVAISNTMNIIGERQDPEKFVPLVLSKVLKGEQVTIHAGPASKSRVGTMVINEPTKPGSRFYLHARNQADALVFLLKNVPFLRYGEPSRVGPSHTFPAGMGRYNVVGEREIDNLQMAFLIAEHAKCNLHYELVDFHSSRPGHDLRYALDGTKMRDLGWTPPVPLEESLRKTVEWTLQPEHAHWLLP
jgi:dTDP-glucose 4,6-dehydratase